METKKKTFVREFSVKSYKCKICGVEFMHKINFDLHYKNHFEDEKPICSFINIFSKCA